MLKYILLSFFILNASLMLDSCKRHYNTEQEIQEEAERRFNKIKKDLEENANVICEASKDQVVKRLTDSVYLKTNPGSLMDIVPLRIDSLPEFNFFIRKRFR